jgi:hypothetical protein
MKLLFLLLALPMIGFGQNVNIPDANFKAYLVGNTAINTNGDTEIQVSEASVFNSYIVVQTLNITDLTGIEAFVSLTGLYCSGNQLTSLDVSTCTALALLYCNDNQLTSLDVSTCTVLYILRCSNNQLTSLDVSTCTTLSYLSCDDNQLTSLNLSTCTVLTEFYCNNNQLTSLNLSTCAALEILDCSNNQLTSLDVSNGIALTDLFCSANNLTSLDLSICTALTDLECYDNQLTSLDVSICTALTDLSCSNNNLTSLNVKNGNNINMNLYAITNPNLSCIEVDNVAWSNAIWADDIDATASFSLNCSGAGISDINESNTLMLYPNPTNGDFTITGLELVGTVSSLSLTDMNGKVVKVLDTKATKFSMASIKPGVYFLNIISGNKQEVLKIVKE